MRKSQNPFILEMKNISKSFGGVDALKDVSFQCRPGTVHALVGENGAGKSTLIKILAGALLPDSGEIIFKGLNIIDLDHNDLEFLQLNSLLDKQSIKPLYLN